MFYPKPFRFFKKYLVLYIEASILSYETYFITIMFMSRPLCKKIIGSLPDVLSFIPEGVAKDLLEFNILSPEEFESLRLCGENDCSMAQGANEMAVSPATFNRLKNRAFKKISNSLTYGRGIKIDNSCD